MAIFIDNFKCLIIQYPFYFISTNLGMDFDFIKFSLYFDQEILSIDTNWISKIISENSKTIQTI